MGTVLLVIVVTVVMIALTALYVAAELATVSARKAKIQQQAAAGNRFAIMLAPTIADSQQLDTAITASQLGITAASMGLGMYGETTWRTGSQHRSSSASGWASRWPTASRSRAGWP
ncbi:MAG: DUF21 domain-containing protein [Oscillochloris sp.]|nr:DUF21 domain-containing protein [Oscillochloris sp.]